jgi:hypothetical protein
MAEYFKKVATLNQQLFETEIKKDRGKYKKQLLKQK